MIMLKLKGALGSERFMTLGVKSSVTRHLQKVPRARKETIVSAKSVCISENR